MNFRFKRTPMFLEDTPEPCFLARGGKNSQLGHVASKHVEKFEDKPFDIYLRCKGTTSISPWHNQWLDRLFQGRELTDGVSIAMNQYLGSGALERSSEVLPEDRERISLYGIVPYLYVVEIILDEVLDQVIISLSTVIELSLAEHGICVHHANGQWLFAYGEYKSKVYAGL
jgi:hypothetical protein